MNAVVLLGLCALGANAQIFHSGVISPYSAYSPNFLHSGVFNPAPITYSVNVGVTPVHTPITPVHTPITYAAAPVPVAPVQTQHHAQDELGQFNFGYYGGPSSRHETRDAFGTVRGAFNYIDGDGKVQHQSYVADAAGFRVAATNLPVAPEAPSGADTIYLNPPKPVEDTPEVATAKAAHQKAFDEAAAAAEAAPDTGVTPARKKRSVGSVAIHSALSPFGYTGFNAVNTFAPHAVAPAAVAPVPAPVTYTRSGFGYSTGLPLIPTGGAVTYGAGHTFSPAVTYNAALPAALSTHDSTLLRVENNPGHAVSYRVY